ncbi:MAG TPA: right-handed parallel beta-helix repeat-containing protein, partial [Polyangiaceae bacterium]|nr:right-handed parallel beta-helix repeat-containing protein [Polyangiaceae bacterium]
MRARTIVPRAVVTIVALGSPAGADTLTVGPAGDHATPCAAFAAAADGDLIEIAAGDYEGDVCAVTPSGLTIRGVGGLAHVDAAGNDAQGKAIWVVQGDDTTIENVEFSGASVPDQNGAGIRQEGTNLTVRGCYFHDNENGILAGDDAASEILIEYSHFEHNGFGDGQSHNLYINHVARLIFQYNWSHRAVIGHLLKSRAAETHVLYNRLTGESDGTESYEIDLPNGGKTYVIGNLIEQGPQTD